MDDTRDMCNIYGQDRYNINVTKCTERKCPETQGLNFQKPVKDTSLHIKDALN